MSTTKSNLGDLLNNDSFILWVNEDDLLTDLDKEKWDLWLSSSDRNKRLLRKAKKIIGMPFKEPTEDCDSEELQRLKDAIRKKNENSQS